MSAVIRKHTHNAFDTESAYSEAAVLLPRKGELEEAFSEVMDETECRQLVRYAGALG